MRITGRGALGVITAVLGFFALIGCSATSTTSLPTPTHPVVVAATPFPTTSSTPVTTTTTLRAVAPETTPGSPGTPPAPVTTIAAPSEIVPLVLPQQTIPTAPAVAAPQIATEPPTVAAPQPVPQAATEPVISCGSGHYVNSNAVCVPDPVAAPSAPSGATARCGDGTYSFSQNRSGTCSHHGGVQRWL
ncbi:DUF3761 domain-containing protein [Nocardia sp. NBC_01503]|uniref:DUF3761 domain-containing protein n=1 Tax=Nocardia sp. NBC_01503 TaxID=2975997 RepID=UPI002E7C17E7|nr:DUF3761 domain-containing protein [Nocardia sp. NBC_01503]WTL35385.1 DUF3761 domain-containing protein [Nocardia sp. NBC_01503]